MEENINNNHGTIFPPAMVFAGYIILVFSVFTLMSHWVFGLLLMLFSIFICFSFSGIDINIIEKKYRVYEKFLGIKSGKWLALDKFLYLTVLHNREVYEMHSMPNVTTSESKHFFDVYMLDKTHREKLLIKRFKDANNALSYAKNLSTMLNIELTTYNPILSAETMQKRYRR